MTIVTSLDSQLIICKRKKKKKKKDPFAKHARFKRRKK